MANRGVGTIGTALSILLLAGGCGGRAGVRGEPPAWPYEWEQENIKTVAFPRHFIERINRVLDRLAVDEPNAAASAPSASPSASTNLAEPARVEPPLADLLGGFPRPPVSAVSIVWIPRRSETEEDLGPRIHPGAVLAVIAKRRPNRPTPSQVVHNIDRAMTRLGTAEAAATWSGPWQTASTSVRLLQIPWSQPVLSAMLVMILAGIAVRPRAQRPAPARVGVRAGAISHRGE